VAGRYRDAAGKKHAPRWLDSVTADVETGTYVDPRANRITVDAWAETWLAGHVHLKPTTRARYRSILDRHVLPQWAELSLMAVSHADVQGWVVDQRVTGAAAATVRKHFRVLSSSWTSRSRTGGSVLRREREAMRRMLGHASAALTLDTYIDLFDDDLDAVAERLDVAARAARGLLADKRRPWGASTGALQEAPTIR
jgi:hypothetical protein